MFIRLLIKHEGAYENTFHKPPSWITGLWIYREDLDAHHMIYGEISSLTHPLYVRARKLKANSFRAFRAGILSDSREQSFETKGAAEPSSQSDEGAGIVLPPKLEAAIEAYRAVKNNQTLRRGRSAKAALMAWLEENSPNLSNQAREEIAKVANGSPEGGAPKTPER